ncbi:tryptophan-rich sensory protein [Maricaulis sp. D1M11]|uniref:tryptophan-rich sensory protein n=1 Tax=Maricaulis sp. D1M11 TaxID=3076117 RepID=UPI0039B41F45
MEEEHRPGVLRLIIYLIIASALTGSLAGWVNASGARMWTSQLVHPDWVPGFSMQTLAWAILIHLNMVSLWLVERSQSPRVRLFGQLLVLTVIATQVLRIVAFFATENVQLGFVLSLAIWVFNLFAIGLVGKISRPAGFVLWPAFVMLSGGLIINFELMRLNPPL